MNIVGIHGVLRSTLFPLRNRQVEHCDASVSASVTIETIVDCFQGHVLLTWLLKILL